VIGDNLQLHAWEIRFSETGEEASSIRVVRAELLIIMTGASIVLRNSSAPSQKDVNCISLTKDIFVTSFAPSYHPFKRPPYLTGPLKAQLSRVLALHSFWSADPSSMPKNGSSNILRNAGNIPPDYMALYLG
jgi:hypothetical protein